MSDGWASREGDIGNWQAIWDGDGWQINLDQDGRFLLFDAIQPWEVPASSFHGSFASLADAQAEAAKKGKPDWSEWETWWKSHSEPEPPHPGIRMEDAYPGEG